MLRNARVDAGLSREALADQLPVSVGVVQALECEQRPPSVTVASRISAALTLDPWTDAVLHSIAVDDTALRTRRGTRHVHRRGHAST